ncbi:MAG: hybrid sensor histidine kinase/response regulator [Magnetococcales bacterium]|nr:hybrid sensor histidine kinase/response regulator [Magnetococcales bacterium]
MSYRKQRIMIVDDERLNINVLNDILKDDYLIKVALNGEQALERAVADPRPDMVLLDIQMPGMDGYQVCRQLKANPETRDIPIIFITALTEEEDEQKGLSLGAVDYIAKPLRPSIILARVRTQMRLKKALKSLGARNAELEKMLKLRETMEQISRHDLKAPLNGILGVANLLLEEASLDQEHKDLLHLQERAGYQMLEMINRSLDMLKMEMGQYVLDPKRVDIVPVVQRILEEHQNRTARLFIDGAVWKRGDSFYVEGEELLFYSMMANLIKNAVEAEPINSEITITMQSGQLGNSTAPIEIGVHNPTLVAESIREHFFDKYATTGKPNGTGLGTYSSKLIAETLGGEIFMETTERRGTSVVMRFPDIREI